MYGDVIVRQHEETDCLFTWLLNNGSEEYDNFVWVLWTHHNYNYDYNTICVFQKTKLT